LASVSARFDNGTNDQAFHPLSGKRGERQDLTLPSRSALHERPKPFAVRLGSAFETEASSRFTLDPRLKPKLRDGSPWIPASVGTAAVLRWVLVQTEARAIFPWITVWIGILLVLLRKDVLAGAASSFLLDSLPGRSQFRSPGASFRPKPWRLSRIAAWAEALAVHRSVFRSGRSLGGSPVR
jgi:hypothetical protein